MLYSKRFYLNIFIVLLVMTNFGCKTINMFLNEEYTKTNGVTPFEFTRNRILLQCEVANQTKRYPFLFDTGASTVYLTDTTIIKDYKKIESVNFGKSVLVDDQTFKNKLIALDIKSNNLFDVKNKAVITFQSQVDRKCDSILYKGIIGASVFRENDYIINLDFEKNHIESLEREQFNDVILNQGYRICDSKFKQGHIYLDLQINNKIIACHFDTGNNGGLIIPTEMLDIDDENAYELTGEMYATVKSKTHSNNVYHEEFTVGFDNQELSTVLCTSDIINKPNIGMNFIKSFNWIIDYKNKKLYYKKNNIDLSRKIISKKDFFVNVTNDALVIAVKNPENNEYKIGDKVVSVNDEKISEDNICDMRTLLNTTADWKTLQVVVE